MKSALHEKLCVPIEAGMHEGVHNHMAMTSLLIHIDDRATNFNL
jgi:hypothetical protein